MAKGVSFLRKGCDCAGEWAMEMWVNLGKNNLWKRILKNVIATTLLVSLSLIPGAKRAIGRAAYLGAITTVFGHPGRRFGQMTEALVLVVAGTVLGVAWSTFGVYLGSLVFKDNPQAAYATRGFFLAVVALVHGFLRSRTPRLFIFVLLMIIVSVVSLTSTAKTVTSVSVTQILYPILIAVGCVILINVFIFPEFSSRFLGQMTIDTLSDTAKALENAGHFFVEASAATDKIGEPPTTSSEEVEKSHAVDDANQSTKENQGSLPIYKRLMAFLTAHWDSVRTQKGAISPTEKPSIKDLTDSKAQIRKKLEACKAAQQECNFEVAVSVLPPREMKPLSITAMKKLVANTIAVISTCESKFALLGDEKDDRESQDREREHSTDQGDGDYQSDSSTHQKESFGHFHVSKLTDEDLERSKSDALISRDKAELNMVKPKREIEFGDARLLRYLLQRAAKPYEDLHRASARAIEVVMACIAYTYDVPTLPSKAHAPKGIMIEEIDIHLSSVQQALLKFDLDAVSALEGAASLQEMEGQEPDIMPREEVFLLSSFLLNVRQAVTHIEEMLKYSRELVLRRQQRHGRRRLYAPRIKWSKWLYTGGEEDESMPIPARKANRKGSANSIDDDDDADDETPLDSDIALVQKGDGDIEKNAEAATSNQMPARSSKPAQPMSDPRRKPSNGNEEKSRALRFRGLAADAMEWTQDSEDVLYAMKLGFALFLVLWPAFIASWNTWYSLNRGLWAALQLVLITEVSIGNSVMTFIVRAFGTTLGCLWGWAAVEARGGNPIVCAAMIFIGIIPCTYVQLSTKYPKAGMVGTVSICVVALASELETVPGTPTENFLKRWLAFLIGGSVALLVEVVLFPVKARTRLTDTLAAALRQINEMERCIAFGIESAKAIDVNAPGLVPRFERASAKANTALSAAEAFLPFCSTEPRIKGSFEGLALIYSEILFVLHQIVDRMDNMLQLRTAYGSGPLEELNEDIYPYRRNVAGSITLTLFAIHSALTTKLPLPQYLPSARLAHLRMINRVREVVLQKVGEGQELEDQDTIARLARQRAVRRKYMSWNAASAAQAEIIEFLEELIDLTKLLVGANEFRSGLLTRPTYRDYAAKGKKADEDKKDEDSKEAIVEANDKFGDTTTPGGNVRRRRGTTASSKPSEDNDVPASLRRIQSRKIEAGLKKQRTNEIESQNERKAGKAVLRGP